MDYEPRTPRHNWRLKLTADEKAQVRAIEFNSANLRKDLAKQAALLNPIRNRAIQRCRQEEKGK